MRYVAFDLEIAKEVDSGGDWMAELPLGITVASTLTSDGVLKSWYAQDEDGRPLDRSMNPEEVDRLVFYLDGMHGLGYPPLTWNGLQFDFAVLYDEAEKMKERAKRLAFDHYDMMFHFFCVKGFPVGLNAVSEGLGLGGKTEGMHGALAPKMWKEGVIQRIKVINYCDKDAILTAEVAQATLNKGSFDWTARSGKLNSFYLDGSRWLTAKESLQLSEPDTSWMTGEPLTRASFMRWM